MIAVDQSMNLESIRGLFQELLEETTPVAPGNRLSG